MRPKPASHPKSSFTDVQSITLIGNLLARHGRAMPNLSTVDKWPNIDGRVEVQDEKGGLVGPLSVQAKTLSRNHKLKFVCPVSFLSYCEIEPCLLFGVDNEAEKVYWCYFDSRAIREVDFKNNKHTKTLYFEASQYFDKDTQGYIEEWTKLIEHNKQRLQGYDELKDAYESILKNSNKIVGTANDRFTKLHLFIDELNRGLDSDFPTIKKFFYPDAWKLGVAYSNYQPKQVSYTLYPIPYNLNDVHIKEVDSNLADRIKEEGLGFTGHFAENPIDSRPDSYAKSVIGSKVSKLVERKLLSHTGHEVLAREFVIAFIDEFHEQMGLPPDKDEYSLSEIQFGFHDYLPHWIEEAYTLMIREERNNIREQLARKGYFDPDVLWQLKPEERKEIQQKVNQSWEKSASARIASRKLDVGLFVEFFEYLKKLNIPVARVYRRPDFSRLSSGGGLVWNKYSKEDAEYNFRTVVENLQNAYEAVRSNNFPTLKEELDFMGDADKLLVQFTAKEWYEGRDIGPIYKMYFTKSTTSYAEKTVELISVEHAASLAELFWERSKEKRGVGDGFMLISAFEGLLDFLYQDTPLLNLIYELIGRRLKEYFGNE